MKHTYKYSLLFFVIFMVACSTKKNTVVTRGFHNLTSRFNGYYYAGESIKEGVNRIERANKDDYTKILPVFIYASLQNSKLVFGEMDRVIQKTSLVIQRHTITTKKGDEIPGAVKWIDENYVLLGKAHFYKHDYFSAIEAFDYVAKTYKKSDSRFVAMLWMIRTYNEIGTLSMSEPIIDYIKNDPEFPKKFQAEYDAATADFYLKQGNNEKGLKHLLPALALTQRKKTRARYSYIVAQLYQEAGDFKKASQFYTQCVKMKPDYEMHFNATISRARLSDAKSPEIKAVKKQLLKMAKDFKNKEYLDQIYYTLAEIEEKQDNIPQAITYLNLSVRNSFTNNVQKAMSFLKLATINFDKQEYPLAQAYYDSTVVFLPKDYPNYEKIAETKKHLTELVKNLDVIQREDSLQKVAAMDEKVRNELIDKIIAKLEAEEKKREQQKIDQPGSNFPANLPGGPSTVPGNQGTGWYFYNTSTVSFGIAEFAKKWGDRKLEDNWRRSAKESYMTLEEGKEKEDTSGLGNKAGPGAKKTADKKSRDYYLQNLPMTSEAKKRSDDKIVDAYYNVGMIYKEQLMNNRKSAEAFELLNTKYSDNKHKLSTFYQLYRLHVAMGNKDKAEIYKNILLKDYPDTEYAKLIKNPDYNRMTQESKNKIEEYYTRAYASYSEGKYLETVSMCVAVDSLYPGNFLMPKFDLLEALALGRTSDVKAFESALQQVIIKYPKEEVKNKAEEVLNLVKAFQKAANDSTAALLKKDSLKTVKPQFIFDNDAEYLWVIVFPMKNNSVDKFKVTLSDFNTQFYASSAFTISNALLDLGTYIVTVKGFAGKDKAMNYYNFIQANSDVFKNLETGSYKIFVISESNYNLFYQDKNVDNYLGFFSQHFLK